MNMLLVVFSNGAIKEETMYQDFDDGLPFTITMEAMMMDEDAKEGD